MNIFEAKEAKMKAFLKYLNRSGATSRKKAVPIVEVEKALRMDNRLFDEITKYLAAEGIDLPLGGDGLYHPIGIGKTVACL